MDGVVDQKIKSGVHSVGFDGSGIIQTKGGLVGGGGC